MSTHISVSAGEFSNALRDDKLAGENTYAITENVRYRFFKHQEERITSQESVSVTPQVFSLPTPHVLHALAFAHGPHFYTQAHSHVRTHVRTHAHTHVCNTAGRGVFLL